MPYTVPTVDDFFERFPIFEDKDAEPIARCLAEAAAEIDTSWREVDYQPAILYLAAHLLATDNSEAGEFVDVGGAPGPITTESFSGMSVSYSSRYAGLHSGGVGASARYSTTEYGRRYLYLLAKNVGGPLVV